MALYAEIILDVQTSQLDRTFEYVVPNGLMDVIEVGSAVNIPFGTGNRLRTGYVVGLQDTRRNDGYAGELKEIDSICDTVLGAEQELVALARWMNHYYGGTFLQALKTVIPVKSKVKPKVRKEYTCNLNALQLEEMMLECRLRGYSNKLKALKAFAEVGTITSEMMDSTLQISSATLKSMVEKKQLTEQVITVYRNGTIQGEVTTSPLPLNDTQRQIADAILQDYEIGNLRPAYIHGVTGSGKTNLYIELTRRMMEKGKQVIVLIPEISLTAQTVLRFYKQFGDRVSFVNSRMSAGERYDQYVRAKNGEIDVMIGPRSALFTPFANIGLILIDEEHDGAYQSEQTPRYSAIETAIHRSRFHHAMVVMGSATPSVTSYYHCSQGDYRLYEMTERAVAGSQLPDVHVVDLREELKAKNRSIFSRELKEAMDQALEKKEQVMLFLNRRGFAGFVSCRSCGHVFTCPHCEVSLTMHRDHTLRCHYCGYSIPTPTVCPECHSPYVAAFGLGTEKVDAAVHAAFPGVRTLVMDRDTTAKKNSMEEILTSFQEHEADVLIGTQMIVKGHDFPNVTVMGIIAADLTLFADDFSAGERTFQLITQAAGRAGRGSKPGNVYIQTYQPENFVIQTAARQDYKAFYEEERSFRRLMHYPPYAYMCEIICFSENEKKAYDSACTCVKIAGGLLEGDRAVMFNEKDQKLSKINDIYRRSVFLRSSDRNRLVEVKDQIIAYFEANPTNKMWLQFAFR